MYEGEWLDDEMHGKGLLTFNHDGGRYEGEFLKNSRNGFGVFTFAFGNRYKG